MDEPTTALLAKFARNTARMSCGCRWTEVIKAAERRTANILQLADFYE